MTTSKLTREAIALRRDLGLAYCGNPPYGMKREGESFVECMREQFCIQQMVSLRSGGLSYAKIGERLAALGHVGRSGKPFRGNAIRRILNRTT